MSSTTSCRGAWWSSENPVRLSAVPHLIPSLPDGRPVSVATIYRWALKGVRGVRLRRFRATAGTWATTEEEVARFQRRLTDAAGEA
jgi:hypothetical protein